jgi:hypothetical protein
MTHHSLSFTGPGDCCSSSLPEQRYPMRFTKRASLSSLGLQTAGGVLGTWALGNTARPLVAAVLWYGALIEGGPAAHRSTGKEGSAHMHEMQGPGPLATRQYRWLRPSCGMEPGVQRALQATGKQGSVRIGRRERGSAHMHTTRFAEDRTCCRAAGCWRLWNGSLRKV